MRHMHSDLMRAPRLQPAGDEAGRAEILQTAPVRHRLAALGQLDHGHALAVLGVAADGRVDMAREAGRFPPDEGGVFAHQRAGAAMIREQSGEALMRRIALGDGEQARCVFVNTVDNARALNAADARKARAAMGDESIDQCAALVACGGMHDKARRLVDDDEIIILIDNGQRNVLALGLRREGRRHVDLNSRARRNTRGRVNEN